MTAYEDNVMDTLKPVEDAPIATSHGVASVALTLAMQYHRITTVQDGTLYQQYKLEGKNMTPLHIDMVFETAIRIERHLLASSDRIAKLVIDAIVTMPDGDGQEEASEEVPDTPSAEGL